MAKDWFCRWLAVLALLAGSVHAQPAPTDAYRQALLIGVWDYEHERDLGPMDADLRALTATFGQMNFDRIVSLPNPTQKQIESAINEAVLVASSVGGDRAVLTVVYFGGHGTMVENTSYLLAKDFIRPSDSSSIIISGGIRSDYLGEKFSQIGQPALLIVEACRNPFVPSDALPETNLDFVSSDAPNAEDMPQPMIGLPVTYPGYVTLFGQTPGKLVEIAPRGIDEATVLVQALGELAPDFASISALGGAVRKRVMEATRGQRYPLEPHTDARGGGEIRLYYDDIQRFVDGREWNKIESRGDAELVRLFLVAYPTSPLVPVAKWRLREHEASVSEQPREYVAYTRFTNAILGRRAPIWERIRPVVIDRNVLTDAGVISGERIEALRRLPGPDQEYQGRAVGGRSFRVSGPLPNRYDVSRVAAFWSDQATSVECNADEIEAGQCASIEQIAELARNQTPEQAGTLYVAAVLDPAYPAADILARAIAVDTRLEALGVPKNAVAFRHFLKAELTDATAPILIKRGDGNLLY